MDKIKALLEKAGVNPELSGKICESLEKYKTTLREQFQREYAAKVEQAKKVCVEETEAHKRELARRVQIFCETKGAAIEAQLTKQSALNESEAFAKLNQISALLGGLANNSKLNGDITAVVEKLKHQAKVATEEKNRAIELANRKTAIAEKVLKRNRELSTVIQQSQRPQQSTSAVTESRNKQKRRIDLSRKSGSARSTRPTLTESQEHHRNSNRPIVAPKGGYTIDSIAQNIDDEI